MARRALRSSAHGLRGGGLRWTGVDRSRRSRRPKPSSPLLYRAFPLARVRDRSAALAALSFAHPSDSPCGVDRLGVWLGMCRGRLRGHGADEHGDRRRRRFRAEGDKAQRARRHSRLARQIDLRQGDRQTVAGVACDKNDRAQAMGVLLARPVATTMPISLTRLAGSPTSTSRSIDPGLTVLRCSTGGSRQLEAIKLRAPRAPRSGRRLDPSNARPGSSCSAMPCAASDRGRSKPRRCTASPLPRDHNVGYHGVMPRVILDHALAGDHGALTCVAARRRSHRASRPPLGSPRPPAITLESAAASHWRDANRRQTCAAVAQTHARSLGRALLDQRIGHRARRTRSAGRGIMTDRLRGESVALTPNAMVAWPYNAKPGLACSAVRRDLGLCARRRDIGEVEGSRRCRRVGSRARGVRRHRPQSARSERRWAAEPERTRAASSAGVASEPR